MPRRTIIPLGDRALTIEFPDAEETPRDLLRCLTAALRLRPLPAVTGLVPAIRTLTVHYDPARTTFDALERTLSDVLATLVVTPETEREPVPIPVCYGGEFGPDLAVVANTHRTSIEAVIAAHTAGRYRVAMLGFLPGFPYLEGLDPSLHTPRRASPRTSVPAGSVGIGGSSTGVYPFTSPGGWQLIGRTPITLFAPERTPPSLLGPGDLVRFVAISAEEYLERMARA
ncbi:MAG: 5-oxoprolinase subunit PxpB [Gemmatimonadaceae bacterium]|nr:5-oxoprolinase subunit PxpB [Gemmatimonadaceae bacterium]